MYSIIVRYGLLLFLALAGLKLLEYQFFRYRFSLDIYLGLVGLFFLLLGLGVAFWLQRPKTTDSGSAIDPAVRKSFSQRELDILVFLCQGYTNKEIAKGLAISPNTVKTHISNIFTKLEVSNRTQAVAEAKLLKIVE